MLENPNNSLFEPEYSFGISIFDSLSVQLSDQISNRFLSNTSGIYDDTTAAYDG